MENQNFIIEEAIELDGFEDETFNVICHDGFAVATSDKDKLKVIHLTYPKIKDLSDIEEAEVLEYRGLPKTEEIHFGDVMMRFAVRTAFPLRD